ncbi:mucin-17 [Aplysia californica]|uniref:Mucin-17 n=1 Tax=Aplysia californica TaxID=6500 RepID=A0ABM1A136_APLCA|nr:mucin-17 [Aplysia californica]
MTAMEEDVDDRFAGIDIDSLLNRRSQERKPFSYGRKKALYESPEFIQRLSGEETVLEGQSLVLECKVQGFPAPSLRWFKDDEELLDHPRIHAEGDGKGGYSLYIDNVNKGDEAAYRCRAENMEGACSCCFFLSVKAKKSNKRKKDSKSAPNKRTVSFPPMFATIVEKVEEEEKQGKELETLPPSPMTDFYYALTLKGRQTWPTFVGDWAFANGAQDLNHTRRRNSTGSMDSEGLDYTSEEESSDDDDENEEGEEEEEEQGPPSKRPLFYLDHSLEAEDLDGPTPPAADLAVCNKNSLDLNRPRAENSSDVENKQGRTNNSGTESMTGNPQAAKGLKRQSHAILDENLNPQTTTLGTEENKNIPSSTSVKENKSLTTEAVNNVETGEDEQEAEIPPKEEGAQRKGRGSDIQRGKMTVKCVNVITPCAKGEATPPIVVEMWEDDKEAANANDVNKSGGVPPALSVAEPNREDREPTPFFRDSGMRSPTLNISPGQQKQTIPQFTLSADVTGDRNEREPTPFFKGTSTAASENVKPPSLNVPGATSSGDGSSEFHREPTPIPMFDKKVTSVGQGHTLQLPGADFLSVRGPRESTPFFTEEEKEQKNQQNEAGLLPVNPRRFFPLSLSPSPCSSPGSSASPSPLNSPTSSPFLALPSSPEVGSEDRPPTPFFASEDGHHPHYHHHLTPRGQSLSPERQLPIESLKTTMNQVQATIQREQSPVSYRSLDSKRIEMSSKITLSSESAAPQMKNRPVSASSEQAHITASAETSSSLLAESAEAKPAINETPQVSHSSPPASHKTIQSAITDKAVGLDNKTNTSKSNQNTKQGGTKRVALSALQVASAGTNHGGPPSPTRSSSPQVTYQSTVKDTAGPKPGQSNRNASASPTFHVTIGVKSDLLMQASASASQTSSSSVNGTSKSPSMPVGATKPTTVSASVVSSSEQTKNNNNNNNTSSTTGTTKTVEMSKRITTKRTTTTKSALSSSETKVVQKPSAPPNSAQGISPTQSATVTKTTVIPVAVATTPISAKSQDARTSGIPAPHAKSGTQPESTSQHVVVTKPSTLAKPAANNKSSATTLSSPSSSPSSSSTTTTTTTTNMKGVTKAARTAQNGGAASTAEMAAHRVNATKENTKTLVTTTARTSVAPTTSQPAGTTTARNSPADANRATPTASKIAIPTSKPQGGTGTKIPTPAGGNNPASTEASPAHQTTTTSSATDVRQNTKPSSGMLAQTKSSSSQMAGKSPSTQVASASLDATNAKNSKTSGISSVSQSASTPKTSVPQSSPTGPSSSTDPKSVLAKSSAITEDANSKRESNPNMVKPRSVCGSPDPSAIPATLTKVPVISAPIQLTSAIAQSVTSVPAIPQALSRPPVSTALEHVTTGNGNGKAGSKSGSGTAVLPRFSSLLKSKNAGPDDKTKSKNSDTAPQKGGKVKKVKVHSTKSKTKLSSEPSSGDSAVSGRTRRRKSSGASRNLVKCSPFGRYTTEGLILILFATAFCLHLQMGVEKFVCYILASYYTFCVLRVLGLLD